LASALAADPASPRLVLAGSVSALVRLANAREAAMAAFAKSWRRRPS
jgi:hypothetical protein